MNKDIEKENFKKDLINLTVTNYQICILFQAITSLKAIFCFSVCCKVMWKYKSDVNSVLGKNSKEPSSSKILTDTSFNDDSNEETLNVNKGFQQ